MKISVITPVYNAEHSIKECLESLYAQTYQGPMEIIIVNDGSTDRSFQTIQQFIGQHPDPRFGVKIIHQENKGVSTARNRGLIKSTGDWIALLDADDEWLPTKIEKQVQILKENPQIDFLGCSRNNEVLKILGKEIKTLHKATVKELLIKMYPQTSTAIFKRRLYELYGGYDEEMSHGEDGFLWVRFCAFSNFYYAPESLVITGKGKPNFGYQGLSANLKAMQEGSEYTIKQARKEGFIGIPVFIVLYIYAKLKYVRRIIITKMRKA